MKKHYFAILFILLIKYSFSQVQELRKYHSIPEEQIVLNIHYNSWTIYPQGMNIEPYSAGVDLYLMQPIFGKNYPISLAAGVGFSVQNIKSNSFLIESKDTLYFKEIPDSVSSSKNKFSTVYIDIPIEFRLRSRPISKKRNVKIAFGFKVGYNIKAYIKYEGDDFMHLTDQDKVKFKRYNIRHVLPYRYGVFVRAGYGKFSLSAYYSLTPLFETNKAQEIIPFSLGLSITLF